MTQYFSNASAIAALNAVLTLIDEGASPAHLVIYGGAVPADADAANSASPIATLTMSAAAFASPVDAGPGASATANAITSDTSAAITASPTFYRIIANGGAGNVIAQGAVNGGGELTLDRNQIIAGDTVGITSFVITHPES